MRRIFVFVRGLKSWASFSLVLNGGLKKVDGDFFNAINALLNS